MNLKYNEIRILIVFFLLVSTVGILADETVKKNKKESVLCRGGSYDGMAKAVNKYEKIIDKYHLKYEVSSALIKAIITAESCMNPKAVSPKGAQGLMQLMPATAKRFGVKDSFDPDENIKGGTRYLKFLLEYYDDDLLDAVAAYNSGEGAVNKYDGVPPYKETRQYVSRVAALYKFYSQYVGVVADADFLNSELAQVIFIPNVIPKSRLSPYKNIKRNSIQGNCEDRAGVRLRQSTSLESSGGIWQRIYQVQKGDTLMRAMQRTGVHKTKLAQMNGLSSRAKLKEGQKLLTWECREN